MAKNFAIDQLRADALTACKALMSVELHALPPDQQKALKGVVLDGGFVMLEARMNRWGDITLGLAGVTASGRRKQITPATGREQ
jgi:hypothetical protein